MCLWLQKIKPVQSNHNNQALDSLLNHTPPFDKANGKPVMLSDLENLLISVWEMKTLHRLEM